MKLSRVESRMFRSYWQDGSLDLVAGLAVVGVGLSWLLGVFWVGMILPPLLVPVWTVVRQRFTLPRLGSVRFSSERRSRLRTGQWVGLLLGVVALAIFVGAYALGDPHSLLDPRYVSALPAVLLGVMAALVAMMLGLGRFLVYAGAFAVAGIAVALPDGEPGWSILGGGAVMAAAGLALLVRFLRSFPVAATDLK